MISKQTSTNSKQTLTNLDDYLSDLEYSSKIPVYKKPIISLKSKYTLNKESEKPKYMESEKSKYTLKKESDKMDDKKIDGVPKITLKKTEPLESIDPPKIKPYSSGYSYYGSSYYQTKRSQESEETNMLLAQISSQLTDLQIRMTVIENKLSKIENYAITDIEI